MDADARSRWVAALRSGQYPQGNSYLQVNGKFCCLGVLCEIEGLDKTSLHFFGAEEACVQYSHGATESSFCLPGEFGAALGINSDEEFTLMRMNDYGYGFDAIADWIEENL